MNKLLTIAVLLLVGYAAQAQEKVAIEKGISFPEYEMQISAKNIDLDQLTPPVAITDCETESTEITYTFKDVTFSGGKYGTLERTWLAIDACGNKATTVQYIALTD